jgi:hypothetical protein
VITAISATTIHLFVCGYWGLVRVEWPDQGVAWPGDPQQSDEWGGWANASTSGVDPIEAAVNTAVGTSVGSTRRFAQSYSWLPPAEVFSIKHSSFATQYLFAFNSVVLALLGNDLHPYTDTEGIFCATVMLLGLVLVSFTIGSLSSIVAEYDR